MKPDRSKHKKSAPDLKCEGFLSILKEIINIARKRKNEKIRKCDKSKGSVEKIIRNKLEHIESSSASKPPHKDNFGDATELLMKSNDNSEQGNKRKRDAYALENRESWMSRREKRLYQRMLNRRKAIEFTIENIVSEERPLEDGEIVNSPKAVSLPTDTAEATDSVDRCKDESIQSGRPEIRGSDSPLAVDSDATTNVNQLDLPKATKRRRSMNTETDVPYSDPTIDVHTNATEKSESRMSLREKQLSQRMLNRRKSREFIVRIENMANDGEIPDSSQAFSLSGDSAEENDSVDKDESIVSREEPAAESTRTEQRATEERNSNDHPLPEYSNNRKYLDVSNVEEIKKFFLPDENSSNNCNLKRPRHEPNSSNKSHSKRRRYNRSDFNRPYIVSGKVVVDKMTLNYYKRLLRGDHNNKSTNHNNSDKEIQRRKSGNFRYETQQVPQDDAPTVHEVSETLDEVEASSMRLHPKFLTSEASQCSFLKDFVERSSSVRLARIQTVSSISTVSLESIASSEEFTNESLDRLLREARTSINVSSESSRSIQFFVSPFSQKVLLLLKAKLYFCGCLNVRLLAGCASVFGYELQPNKKIVTRSLTEFGPVSFCPESSNGNTSENIEKLYEYLTSSDFNKITAEFDSSKDAVIALGNSDRNKSISTVQRYLNDGKECLEKLDNISLFPEIESRLQCNFSRDPRTGLRVNPQWQEICMSAASRQVIIGGRQTGKSTLLRYLINNNLSKFPSILLIDLDVDRPEVFLPKTVSATVITKPFFSPGFLKNLSPIKSFLLGSHTSASSPEEYLKYVSKLLNYCRTKKKLKKIPWIVNTMKYTEKIHFETTIQIIRAVSPTHLIQIQGTDSLEFEINLTPDTINNFGMLTDADGQHNRQKCLFAFHIVDTVVNKEKIDFREFSTIDLQTAIVLSRLVRNLPSNKNFFNMKPIAKTSLNELKILVNTDVPQHLHSSLINGNLCYLCQSKDDEFVKCYEVGFVKCVDAAADNVYLFASIDKQKLKKVNALAVCDIPVPMSMLLDQFQLKYVKLPYVYRADEH